MKKSCKNPRKQLTEHKRKILYHPIITILEATSSIIHSPHSVQTRTLQSICTISLGISSWWKYTGVASAMDSSMLSNNLNFSRCNDMLLLHQMDCIDINNGEGFTQINKMITSKLQKTNNPKLPLNTIVSIVFLLIA